MPGMLGQLLLGMRLEMMGIIRIMLLLGIMPLTLRLFMLMELLVMLLQLLMV